MVDIPKETLEELYVERQMTVNMIAAFTGHSSGFVKERMKEHDIGRRPAWADWLIGVGTMFGAGHNLILTCGDCGAVSPKPANYCINCGKAFNP